MTPKPLDQIGLRDHRVALWWLGLLYRKPGQFEENLPRNRKRMLSKGFMLFLHALPYILSCVTIGLSLLFFVHWKYGVLTRSPKDLSDSLLWFGSDILFGIAGGMAGGIPFRLTLTVAGQFLADARVGKKIFFLASFILGISFGIGALFIAVILLFMFGNGFYATWIGGLIIIGFIGRSQFGIAAGLAVFLTTFVGLFSNDQVRIGDEIAPIMFSIFTGVSSWFSSLRGYYWPFGIFFVWPKLRPLWYPYHPVAWDDLCSLPFLRFDELLAAFAEYDPTKGKREIARLIDHYPSQRLSALRALARLIAREAGRETRLSRLDAIVANLPEGESGFLKRIPKLRESVGEISQLQNRLETQDRPFLREPTSALLCEKIKNFQNQVAGYPEPLSSEFRQAAAKWLEIAEREHQKIRQVLNREPNPQVFRAGDPVNRGKEAFVPREAVLGELDRQLTLSTGCPGLIIYARRRMGKSTLLQNLDGFLPTSTRTAVVSMQNPDAFTTQENFLELIIRWLLINCPEATGILFSSGRDESPRGDKILSALTIYGYSSSGHVHITDVERQITTTSKVIYSLPFFFKLLETCNLVLKESDSRLLLAIDEYENIDEKIGQGVFSEDLLATIRESIQYHRQIIWVFAGSRSIAELKYAPWPSYLISARTLEIPPFSEAETRRLLTEPLRNSPLWEENDPRRPRFEPGFWGEGGIERIHREAGGWPHLVQLLAETAIDLSNDREKGSIDAELLEQAIRKAVGLGDTVLRQLLKGEASEAEWAYINGFRRRDVQAPPEDEAVYRGLRRRLVVEEVGNGDWRLRVPLMLRWLRERG